VERPSHHQPLHPPLLCPGWLCRHHDTGHDGSVQDRLYGFAPPFLPVSHFELAEKSIKTASILTEGWDANTVTHVLGVRAFGTQLLCEQVIGRSLRRQSYELNEENLLNVEYADVLSIPFDFTAKPVVAPPQPPRETVQVKAMQCNRIAITWRFAFPASRATV
jgi:hypothetical protein